MPSVAELPTGRGACGRATRYVTYQPQIVTGYLGRGGWHSPSIGKHGGGIGMPSQQPPLNGAVRGAGARRFGIDTNTARNQMLTHGWAASHAEDRAVQNPPIVVGIRSLRFGCVVDDVRRSRWSSSE